MASTTMADLLKQAEAAGISSFTPEKGNYNLRVVGANASKTKKLDPKFGVQFEIIDGPDAGKKFWINLNLIAVKNDGTPNSMGLAITFKQLAALGADAAEVATWDVDASDASERVARALTGSEVSAEIAVRESNGYTNIDLKNVKPRAAAPAPAPAAPTPAAPANRPF